MTDTAAYLHRPVRLVSTGPLLIPELGTVRAGFPSPAEDLGAKRIDLAEKLIRNPQATFYWRARGHAMRELGIADGDLLVVDKAVRAQHGHIVIAETEGEYVCRKLVYTGQRATLRAGDPSLHSDITPSEGGVWGVVTYCIKRLPQG